MIKLILPLPDKCLHSNARPHWAQKAKAVKEARYAAGMAATAAKRDAGMVEPFKAATVRLVYYFRTAHQHDPDGLNSWCKAYFDGIADSGIVKNDRYLTPLPAEQHKDASDPRLEVFIEETTE